MSVKTRLCKMAIAVLDGVPFWEIYMGGITLFSIFSVEETSLSGWYRVLYVVAFIFVWHPISKIIESAYKRTKEQKK